MEKLLKRWSELEPKACNHTPGGSQVDHVWFLPGVDWGFDEPGEDLTDLPSIQGAVQLAIEARGWYWSLPNAIERGWGETWSIHSQDKLYRAVVIYGYGQFNYECKQEGESPENPAEALLSAYIAALEATKTEEVEGCLYCFDYNRDPKNNVPCREHQK